MVAIAVMTTLCTVGVVFYVRFLIAACKECKRSWIGYLVRLHPEVNEYTVVEPQRLDRSFHRAA